METANGGMRCANESLDTCYSKGSHYLEKCHFGRICLNGIESEDVAEQIELLIANTNHEKFNTYII